MKFIVDQDTCVSCGLCVDIAGGVFTFNENAKAEVYDEAANGNKDNAIRAMRECPSDAISIK